MDNIDVQQANIISTCFPPEQPSINEWFFYIHNHHNYNHVRYNNSKLQSEKERPNQQTFKEVSNRR